MDDDGDGDYADGVGAGGADGVDGIARCLGSILRACTPRILVGMTKLDWDPTRRRRTYGSSEYMTNHIIE